MSKGDRLRRIRDGLTAQRSHNYELGETWRKTNPEDVRKLNSVFPALASVLEYCAKSYYDKDEATKAFNERKEAS